MFFANGKYGPQAGHCAIVKSKGSKLPLLGRRLKTGTDGAEAAVVQPPAEGQRPSSDEPATRLFCAE
jgi:hypothetical protein